VRAIEATVQHDVIAFLTNVAEHVGPEARYIHLGLTSSDVVDTAQALQMVEAADLLIADLEGLAKVLEIRAFEHKNTVMVGRTHGMHAEPTTFGLKLALFHAETRRDIERLQAARGRIAVGKLSGAVGTFAHLEPAIEAAALAALKLEPVAIASQVVQRDRHAEFLAPSRWRRRRSRKSPSSSGTCSAARSARSRSRSARVRKAPRRCRTRETRSVASR